MKFMNKAKTFGANQKRKAVTLCGAAGALIASGAAHAELPAAVEAGFETLKTDANTMIGYGWGGAILVTGALIAIGLFKKISKKSLS